MPATSTPRRIDVFRRPPAFDLAVTAVFVVLGVVLLFVDTGHAAEYRDPDALGVCIIIATTLPLLFRRSAPIGAGVVGALVPLSLIVWGYAAPLAVIVMVLLVYSAAAYGPLGGSIAVTVMHAAVSVAYGMAAAGSADVADRTAAAITAVSLTIGFGGFWAIGRAVRGRRRYTLELEDRTARLERARGAEVRAALAEERSRIARELHDVVAHHVSVMTVQAAGARRLVDRDPARSAEAMAAVESTGRAALMEMRRIVGVLRDPGEPHSAGGDDGSAPATGADRAPQPGLTDLDALADQFRKAGLPVQVVVEGTPHGLPVGVDLTAYRIVQEALTNTIKHAGPSSATVHVRHEPGEVTLRVSDDGRGLAAALDGRRPGHGLLGMRERVAIYGGTLAVGPRRDGGFDVRARIPFDTAGR